MKDVPSEKTFKTSEDRRLQVQRNRESDKQKRAIVVKMLMEGKSRNEIIAQCRYSPAIIKSAMQRYERLKNNGTITKRCAECGHMSHFRPDEAHLKHCRGCRHELGEIR